MIESKRLTIRPFLSSDIDTVFDWFFDSDVMRWIPSGPDSSLSDHKKRIQNYARHFEEFGFSKYLLVDKLTGERIGDAGILHLDQTNMLELGYRIKKSRWRQGFATEACQAIIEHTFSETKIGEINAIVEAENVVSVNILEDKLGFQFQRHGIFLGVPMNLYGLDAKKYRKLVTNTSFGARMSDPIGYFRVHTSDTAFLTKKPRGLFTTIGKLVDSKTMTENEIEEYWKNRHWFESNLPVPPFYQDGNTIKAITWFKNGSEGNQIFRKMTFYLSMARKYGVPLFITRSSVLPGKVVYEDNFQIGVTESSHEGPEFLTEELVDFPT